MQLKYPSILALIAQLIAGVITLLLFNVFHFSLVMTAIIQGLLALLIGKYFKLNYWWLVINFLFVPAILMMNTYKLPNWIFLVGFILLLLINWNSFKDRVPLYLTGRDTLKKLEELLADQKKTFKFIDLGSGLARTLIDLSKKFPESEFYGVETAPLVFLISWLRTLLRKNCHIRYLSIWKVNLCEYDIVYCFLSPVPMPALWEKAKSEMKKDSLLVSNTFSIPGVQATKTIVLNDWRDSKILIWQI